MPGSDVDKSSMLDLVEVGVSDSDRKFPSANNLRQGRLDRSIMMIPVKSIVSESPVQSRQEEFDPKNNSLDSELVESIREHGVLEPIMVARVNLDRDEPQYHLIFGSRRTNAAKHLKRKMIPAIIAKDEDQLDLLTLAENTGRSNLTPFEQAVALGRIQESNSNLSTRKLAQKTGISHSSVSNLLRAYNDSGPALRGLFSQGTDARAIVELQPLFETLGENDQVALADKLQGLSRQKIISIKDMLTRGIDVDVALSTDPLSDPKPIADKGEKKRPVQRTDQDNSSEKSDTLDLNKEQIILISSQTGASSKNVKDVISKAVKNGAGMDAVYLVCAYLGKGGSSNDALLVGMQLADNRCVMSLLKKYFKLRQRTITLEQKLETGPQKEFFKTIFQDI